MVEFFHRFTGAIDLPDVIQKELLLLEDLGKHVSEDTVREREPVFKDKPRHAL